MHGWVRIHRKITDWEWYKVPEMAHLFMHLIINANHEDGKWQGVEIKRGQLITGRKKLHFETGISEQSIRTYLKRLVRSGEIIIEPTIKNSLITICRYGYYQKRQNKINQQTNQQLTSNQPAGSQKLTTNNNVNNKMNVREKIYSAEILNFYDEIIDLFPERAQPQSDTTKNKWLETLSKLQNIEKYSLLELKNIITNTRKDFFWSKHFLSINKLRSKNKEGVMWVHVFAEIAKNVATDFKIKEDEMQEIMKDPNRFKF